MAQMSGMQPQRGTPPPFRGKAGMLPMMKKPMPMMADGGGIGSPSLIGGGGAAPPMMPKAPMPPPAGGGVDPDMDGDMDSPMIKPEAVNYHDDCHTCGPTSGGPGCQYFGDGDQCAVLKMQVSPSGACTAFEAKGGGEGEGAPDDMGGGGEDMMPEDAGAPPAR